MYAIPTAALRGDMDASGSRSAGAPAFLAPAALALVAVIWGVTFTVADEAAATFPSADLVLWRFGLGALVLTLFSRRRPAMPAAMRGRGAVLGALLGAGFLLQTWGLTYTDALTSGFLTSLLVVIAPIAGWVLFGERLTPLSWAGVGLATGGVLVLSLHGARLGPGELITLGSAALWGLHVVLLSRWSTAGHAFQLARIQTATVAVMALLAILVRGLATGTSPVPVLPSDAYAWLSVGFLAVLATAVAMALLSWSQARVNATRAAVILTLEPVVAGLTAVLTGTDVTVRVLLGAAMLLGALYVTELGGGRVLARCRADRLGETARDTTAMAQSGQ